MMYRLHSKFSCRREIRSRPVRLHLPRFFFFLPPVAQDLSILGTLLLLRGSTTPLENNAYTDDADPGSASIILAKLQNPIKKSFTKANDDLKGIHSGLVKYSKVLDKVGKCNFRGRASITDICILEIQGQATPSR